MTQILSALTHTILLVEPDRLVRSTVAAVLRDLDLAQVYQAASVSTGEQVLMNSAVDALILSLSENDDEVDIVTRLRAGEFPINAGIPVAVIATVCDSTLVLRLKELAVSRLLLRPFKIRDIIDTVGVLVPDSSSEVR